VDIINLLFKVVDKVIWREGEVWKINEVGEGGNHFLGVEADA
jgi:hypothetical protein